MLRAIKLARGNANVRAFAGQQPHDAPADGTGGGQHGDRRSVERHMLSRTEHGGGGRRVRAVRIEHHRHAHRPEKALARFGEQLLAGRDVAAADEHGRVLQIGRAAREHRAVHEVAHGVGRHAAVPEQLIDARIDRDDAVEHARLRVGVEAERGFWQVTWSRVSDKEPPAAAGELSGIDCRESARPLTRTRGTDGPPCPCRR